MPLEIGKVIDEMFDAGKLPVAKTPPTDPRLNIAGITLDAEYADIIVTYLLRQATIPVALASAQRILAQAEQDGTIEKSQGFEEYSTAMFYWLRKNEYVRLLPHDEGQEVLYVQSELKDPWQKQQRRRSPITGRFKGGGGKYQ